MKKVLKDEGEEVVEEAKWWASRYKGTETKGNMLLLSASSFIHSVYARGSLVWSLLGAEAAKVNEIWATSATSQPWALLSP